MSFIDFLEKLQNKPESSKNKIIFVSVTICMLIIFSLWAVSLRYSLSSSLQKEDKDESIEIVERIKQEAPSLMDTLEASVGAFFEDDESSLEEAKKAKENLINTYQENEEEAPNKELETKESTNKEKEDASSPQLPLTN